MNRNRNLTQKQDLMNFEPLVGLRQGMDHLFEDFFSMSAPKALMPKSNIYEDAKNYHIEVQVPGMQESNLNISLDGRVLSISGEERVEHEQNEKNYHRVEFSSSEINRSWELPPNVDIDRLEANFRNGILDVVLPKMHTSEVSKKIKINTH